MRPRTTELLLLILCLHLASTPLDAADQHSATAIEGEAAAQPAEILTLDEKLDRILDLLERLGADDPVILREIEDLRSTETQPREQEEGPEGSVDLLWRTTPSAPTLEPASPCTCCPDPCPPDPGAVSHRWRWRNFGSSSSPHGAKRRGTLEASRFQFDLGKGSGFGFELERLLGEVPTSESQTRESQTRESPKWGWALGLSRVDLEALWMLDSPDFWIRDNDRVALHALTTGFNRHWRGDGWDFFAGPLLALLDLDHATFADGTDLPGTLDAGFDRDLVLGGTLAVDLLLGDAWGLTAGAQYFELSSESELFDLQSSLLTTRLGLFFDF